VSCCGSVFAAASLALLLAGSAALAAPTGGFLGDQDLKFAAWAPPTPALDGPAQVADLAVYLQTRPLVAGPRGSEAHDDDVYLPPDVAHRFKDALGIDLTPANAKVILDTIQLVQKDLEVLVAPVKQPVANGGRVRPYVQYPALPACPHVVDDSQFGLNKSGSFPSTHAGVGMLWALILTQLAPDKADAVAAKGYQFGESRLVCGFHYPSDLAAGRLAMTVLFARLQTNQAFKDQMLAAKAKMDELRGLPAIKPTPTVQKLLKDAPLRVPPTLLQPQ
jgi:acid phosphatase (class A)